MQKQRPIIYWYRRDLRIDDLPGLLAAAATGRPIVACYIHDQQSSGDWGPGAASQWWLHHSLASLDNELKSLGSRLVLRAGETISTLRELAAECNASGIHFSRHYAPWESALEEQLHEAFAGSDVECKRFPGALLYEPEQVQNRAGQAFRVFTPFWRACQALAAPKSPWGKPQRFNTPAALPPGVPLDALELVPQKPDWASHWTQLWQPGGAGAQRALDVFIAQALEDYDESRNHPARNATSRLSPHLHFGEISPSQVWHTTRQASALHSRLEPNGDKFLSELGWREFNYHMLHHFPALPEEPFKQQFADFPWLGSAEALSAWQQGLTGYPMVDAGMRELWQTGFMHNRVRMICASFLTKHLLVPWQAGARWFWDTLVDADLANNSCGWQWVAGCGADAAPYFRIFNPTLQGRKFDPEGHYIRRWIPAIAALPDKYIHEPSSAPAQALQEANLCLGSDYPAPIVEHRAAREAALAAYSSVKSQSQAAG